MKDYRISNFIYEIGLNIDCEEKYECLKKMAERIADKMNLDADDVFSYLKAREKFGSTALGGQFALPHAKMDKLDEVIGGLFTTKNPIDFGSLDDIPTRIFFVVLAPSAKPSILLKAVAKVAKVFKDEQLKEKILSAKSEDEIMELIKEKEESIQKA